MNNNHIKELARSRARDILGKNETFKRLPMEEQKKMYHDVVEDEMLKIQQENGGELAEAKLLGNLIGAGRKLVDKATGSKIGEGKASELIDDERHEKGFEDGVDAFEDLVDSVDFPKFVKDLLKGVFDANITVMKAQTDDYIRLMKEATTGLAKFIKDVNDDDAKAYAAENSMGDLNILVEGDGDSEKIELTKPDGEKVEDAELAAIMADAKIKMAQEHRAALREMILMGVTRLVVERGEVEAEVNFEFKGKREVKRSDKALKKKDSLSQSSDGHGGGFLGSIFGGPKSSNTTTERGTQFSVSSAKSTQEDELKAKLRGFVNIKFKTDYFKLDNFAQMYGPPTPEQQQAAQQQQLPAPRPKAV